METQLILEEILNFLADKLDFSKRFFEFPCFYTFKILKSVSIVPFRTSQFKLKAKN